MSEARALLGEFIAELLHEHCSWDDPGGCDGHCDCHVAEIQAAWRTLEDELAAAQGGEGVGGG